MKYQGYEAIIEYDDDDRIFVGRVINTRDVIAFDGMTVDELEASFKAVIDEYLEDCAAINKDPDKPYSGKFNLRLPPELHRQVAIQAEREGQSLNSYIELVLQNAISL